MFILAVVEFGLAACPRAAFKFWLSSTEPRKNRKLDDVDPTIQTVLEAIRSATRYVPGSTNCLVQAISTKRMLADIGLKTYLRLGVASQKNPFMAHAWLEYDGKPVIGGECIAQFTNSFPAL